MPRFEPRTDLRVGDEWVDITGDVYQRDDLKITRGRPDETAKVDAGKLTLTLNNRHGKYSPRNPESPYYGLIGRNTPIRVRVGPVTHGAAVGEHSAAAPTQTAPATSLDTANGLLISGWTSHDEVDPIGTYTLPSSMTAITTETSSTVSVMADASEPVTSGLVGQRIADYSGSADGYTAYQVAIPGEAGTPTIAESYAVVDNDDITLTTSTGVMAGQLLVAVQSWSSIGVVDPRYELDGEPGGTAGDWSLVADSELRSTTVPATRVWIRPVAVDGAQEATFTIDFVGSTVYQQHARLYVIDGAELSLIRFVGEVANWPPRWDASGADAYVPVQAAGILRRLGQTAGTLRSALYRESVSPGRVTPVAYWPCEDGPNATQIASALDGGLPMGITGTPELSSYTGFPSSDAIPLMKDGEFAGPVAEYESGTKTQLRWIMHLPSSTPSGTTIISIRNNGAAARRWDVVYHSTDTLQVIVYRLNGDVLYDTGALAFTSNAVIEGEPVRMSLECTQNDDDVDFGLVALNLDASTGGVHSDTVTGATFKSATRVVVGPEGGLGDVAIGHVSVYNLITSIFDLNDGFNAWVGEPAGDRIERLATEEGIPLTMVGEPEQTPPVGPQGVDSALRLMQDAAEADGGILHESRDRLGLTYRCRTTLYNRSTLLPMDYATGQISPPLEPVEDDQATRNDVTVSREGGSSARAVRTDGPLSVQQPPDGVGIYDTSITLDLGEDDGLQDQAGWRLRLGTVDAPRYPNVAANLARNPELIVPVTSVDSGDRATIDNPPVWVPPRDIDLMVQGYTERLSPEMWTWEANTSPGGAWTVAEADHATRGRYDTAGSQIEADVTSTDTTLPVRVTADARWITTADHPGEFPFRAELGGEVVTVTGVTDEADAAAFLDEFTRTRSNGWDYPADKVAYASFEEGASGDPIQVEDDVIEVVGPTYTTTSLHGNLAMHCANDAYVRVANNTGTPSHTGSLHAWIYQSGTGASRILNVTSSVNVNLALIRANADGTVSIADAGNAAQATTSLTWSTGVPFRLDWQWDASVAGTQAAPVIQARLYPDYSDPDTFETIQWTASGLSADAGRWTVGTLAPTTDWSSIVDTIRVRQFGDDWWPSFAEGDAWIVSGGTASEYEVSTGAGRISLNAIEQRHHAVVGEHLDALITVSITVPVTPTGGNISPGIIGRWNTSDQYYFLGLFYRPDGTIAVLLFKQVDGTYTLIRSEESGLSVVGGDTVHAQFEMIGSSLRGRVWMGTQTDPPAAWTIVATDSDVDLPGPAGVHANLNDGNTNTQPVTIAYDNFRVQSPDPDPRQTFEVERSTNGIVKAHKAGTAISLDQPAYIAL